ncbi:hypothetical protein IJ541_09610 [bacterium]|nr:hypothetical protein [bacterium]
MASVLKTMSIMTGASILGGAGASYYINTQKNKFTLAQAKLHAQNGKIPIGGRTPDGTFWDGAISIDEFQKQLDKRRQISAVTTGLLTGLSTAIISGFTLLLRGKIKA